MRARTSSEGGRVLLNDRDHASRETSSGIRIRAIRHPGACPGDRFRHSADEGPQGEPGNDEEDNLGNDARARPGMTGMRTSGMTGTGKVTKATEGTARLTACHKRLGTNT
jgi:hypothetical protein